MERDKAAGGDQLHVEMLKANIPKIAQTLVKCWKAIGKSRIIPPGSTILPQFKGKWVTPKNTYHHAF